MRILLYYRILSVHTVFYGRYYAFSMCSYIKNLKMTKIQYSSKTSLTNLIRILHKILYIDQQSPTNWISLKITTGNMET